jgi:hypothetical protein
LCGLRRLYSSWKPLKQRQYQFAGLAKESHQQCSSVIMRNKWRHMLTEKVGACLTLNMYLRMNPMIMEMNFPKQFAIPTGRGSVPDQEERTRSRKCLIMQNRADASEWAAAWRVSNSPDEDRRNDKRPTNQSCHFGSFGCCTHTHTSSRSTLVCALLG